MNFVSEKLILYSSIHSQWASVPLLGLEEKRYDTKLYDIKEIDLVSAANFDPEYLQINPNGTVPALTAPSLTKPLVDSRDILQFIDDYLPSGPQLKPKYLPNLELMHKIIDLVHSDEISTNLILLQARTKDEMEKKIEQYKEFVGTRQRVLENYDSAFPGHPFYGPKKHENDMLYKLYTTEIGPEHEKFFRKTDDMYHGFGDGINRLESLIALPFAASHDITQADLHVIPWLSHAMWAAGASEIQDFRPLEELIQKSVPDFNFGPKIKIWWSNVTKRQSFLNIFPKLH